MTSTLPASVVAEACACGASVSVTSHDIDAAASVAASWRAEHVCPRERPAIAKDSPAADDLERVCERHVAAFESWRVRAAWERAEDRRRPMTGRQLAKLLGVSDQHGRKVAARWRRERLKRAEAASAG